MGIINVIKLVFVMAFFMSFSQASSAAQRYWWVFNNLGYYNPSSACSASGSQWSNGVSQEHVSSSVASYEQGAYGPIAVCRHVIKSLPGGSTFTTQSTVSRQGSECPAPYIYNETTFSCFELAPVAPTYKDGDLCTDQTGGFTESPMIYDASAGKCVGYYNASKSSSCKHLGNTRGTTPEAFEVVGSISSSGSAVAPPSFSHQTLTCEMKTVSSSDCILKKLGAEVTCSVMATFTGNINTAGTKKAADAKCPNGECPVKEVETKTTEEGCVPSGTGNGGTTCTQKKETATDGQQQCGYVNGAYACITKKPSSNGIVTTITASTENLSDGGVKVTTVKDSTLTNCTDVGKCTSSTSSTTSSSTTSASGGTKTDTTCKGTCTSTGGGVETLPNVGSGNSGTGSGGSGTGGNGEGEEEGDGGTASTTQDCAVPPPCDGDPFQCAILQQAHVDTCKLMAAPTAAELGTVNAKIASERAAIDSNQASMDSKVNTLLSNFQGSTGGTGAGTAKCLPDIPFSVRGHSMTIPFSRTCESIGFVRMAILAMAYLVAARIVFREV